METEAESRQCGQHHKMGAPKLLAVVGEVLGLAQKLQR
jgi:hypothetical protein